MDDERQDRRVPDRELRHLSTAELITLIQQDIRELDSLIAVRRRAKRQRTAKEAVDAACPADEPEELALHSVVCCNHHMGDYPAFARVRCPFCNEWHRAGDFPEVS
ncbi:MAG TPA: hypothetical protein VK464_25215 [Symbiobacteriaceae bacterium]|nr:hypothetical protein [Symbiobacteriaceae bacterium]